jgi:hypothetical protein
LLFFKETKVKINIIKIKAKVKLLSAKLGKGREDKLKVKAGLFSNVKNHDV